MQQFLRCVAGLALLLAGGQAPAQQPSWTASTDAERWKVTPSVRPARGAATATVRVYPDQRRQTMEGFGGCFNEAGWEALLTLPPARRTEVLRQLFAPSQAAFTWARLPVAANDYSLSYFSYDDVPQDFGMRNFNIDRDRYIIIPYIKAARQLAPGLRLWASPWSPPAWMKVNNHYSMGSNRGGDAYATDMAPGQVIKNNATAFRMEEEYLRAYALYLSKFVQAYAKEGLAIERLCPQNEIVYQPHWPSCTWRPDDLAYFIAQHLGPKFRADQLKTAIWLGTVNTADPSYARTVLGNQDAAGFIKGLGVQWDAKQAVETLHREFPQVPIMQTESECGNGENNWKSAEYTWSLVRRYVGNGTSLYMYWNMVLDETGRSSWGWVQNALININKTTGQVTYNPEYYLLRHLGRYVRPGAVRLATTEGNQLAFQNTDNSTVLLLANTENAPQTLTLALGARQTTVTVQPHSFNTFCWQPLGGLPRRATAAN